MNARAKVERNLLRLSAKHEQIAQSVTEDQCNSSVQEGELGARNE